MAAKKAAKATKKKPIVKKKAASRKTSAKRSSAVQVDTLGLSPGMKEYLLQSPHVFSFSQMENAVRAYHRQAEINKRRGLSDKGYQTEGFQDGYGSRTPRDHSIRPLKPYDSSDPARDMNLPRFFLPFLEFGSDPTGRANYQTSSYYNSRAPKR